MPSASRLRLTRPMSVPPPPDAAWHASHVPPRAGVDPVAVVSIVLSVVGVLLGPFGIALIFPAGVLGLVAFLLRDRRPGSRLGHVALGVSVVAFVVWVGVLVLLARAAIGFLGGGVYADPPPEAGGGDAGEAVVWREGRRRVVPLDVCRAGGPAAEDEHGYVLYAEPGRGRRLSVRDDGRVRVGLRRIFPGSFSTSTGVMEITYDGSSVTVTGGDELRIAARCVPR
jgi:hypothetical protein